MAGGRWGHVLWYYMLDFMIDFNFVNHISITNSVVFICSPEKPIEISRYVEVLNYQHCFFCSFVERNTCKHDVVWSISIFLKWWDAPTAGQKASCNEEIHWSGQVEIVSQFCFIVSHIITAFPRRIVAVVLMKHCYVLP